MKVFPGSCVLGQALAGEYDAVVSSEHPTAADATVVPPGATVLGEPHKHAAIGKLPKFILKSKQALGFDLCAAAGLSIVRMLCC